MDMSGLTKKRWLPYLLIILGCLILLYTGIAILAGGCILVGIVMIIEFIWPEHWGRADNEATK